MVGGPRRRRVDDEHRLHLQARQAQRHRALQGRLLRPDQHAQEVQHGAGRAERDLDLPGGAGVERSFGAPGVPKARGSSRRIRARPLDPCDAVACRGAPAWAARPYAPTLPHRRIAVREMVA